MLIRVLNRDKHYGLAVFYAIHFNYIQSMKSYVILNAS